MALNQSELAVELQNLAPTGDPLGAALALAGAYGAYMKGVTLPNGAEANSAPILDAAIDATAIPAMSAAMTFSSNSSALAGAGVVINGLTAFWGALIAAPATFFPAAIAITPPSFASLASALAVTFASNVTLNKDLSASTAAMASDIHTATVGQGIATFPPSLTFPIL